MAKIIKFYVPTDFHQKPKKSSFVRGKLIEFCLNRRTA
jgi:hypothetical protein